MIKNEQLKYYVILIALYICFITIGFPQQALGVAWDKMSIDFLQPLESGGILLALTSITGAIASFMIGFFLKKTKFLVLLILSCILMALGMYGYSVTPQWVNIILYTIPIGFGSGLINASINNYFAHNYSSKLMNWLHGFWGLGGTIAPAIMNYTIKDYNSWRLGYKYFAIIQLVLLVLLLLGFFFHQKNSKKEKTEEVSIPTTKTKSVSYAMFLSTGLFFLYTSIAGSMGLWLHSVTSRTKSFDDYTAGNLVVLFWGALTAGRFIIGSMSNKIGNRKIISYGILGTIVGMITLIFSGYYLTIFAVALAGFSMSCQFPSMMHETKVRFDKSILSTIAGYQTGSALIGYAVSPFAIGYLISNISLTYLFPTLSILTIIMFFLNRKLNKLS